MVHAYIYIYICNLIIYIYMQRNYAGRSVLFLAEFYYLKKHELFWENLWSLIFKLNLIVVQQVKGCYWSHLLTQTPVISKSLEEVSQFRTARSISLSFNILPRVWLGTGFWLVIGFIEHFWIVTASNYSVSLIHALDFSLQHKLHLSFLRLSKKPRKALKCLVRIPIYAIVYVFTQFPECTSTDCK
jgi:hypothetical protein